MKSERLNIVQCTIDILEAAIQSNEALAKKLGFKKPTKKLLFNIKVKKLIIFIKIHFINKLLS